jgi:hypothetical protein
MNCTALDLVDVLDSLDRLDTLDERTFHEWEFDLVQRYRRNEAEQEAIAIEVTRHKLRDCPARTRARLDELLAMLETAHDPWL